MPIIPIGATCYGELVHTGDTALNCAMSEEEIAAIAQAQPERNLFFLELSTDPDHDQEEK